MSDAQARPLSEQLTRNSFASFDVEAEYVWIDCDLPGAYEGFKVEVRMNLRNRDRKRLTMGLDDITAERDRISDNAKRLGRDLDAKIKAVQTGGDDDAIAAATEEKFQFIEETAAAYDRNVARIHALIAPYVRAWNVMDRDDAGDLIDAPAPMVAGVDAFESIDQQMTWWLVNAVTAAYRGGKGFSSLSRSVAGSDELLNASTEPTPSAPENPSVSAPASLKNSSSRSRSTSPTSDRGSTGTPIQPSCT